MRYFDAVLAWATLISVATLILFAITASVIVLGDIIGLW